MTAALQMAGGPTNAAIYFHPEAYTTAGPKLMGRNAAGESFLRGYLAHGRADAFWAVVQRREHVRPFAASVRAAGRGEPVKAVLPHGLAALAEPGTLYYPGPDIGTQAWHRSFFGHAGWSLAGITHTTCSAAAMDAVAGWLLAPVQPWDAVICTSTAVKRNVECILEAQADYLADRLGAARFARPRLPVIPLGIDTAALDFSETERTEARSRLAADAATIVILFLGRLSFHAKAHPLAMYQALERAAAALPDGERALLVECGSHANEHIRDAFAEGARAACPSVRVVTLDGRDAEDRRTAWASADVFCSLSDNIQESFGMAPLEAMAAGLPVVVSDWDGYRDTVRHGVDGFTIATIMPGAGHGADLARRHALGIDTYDRYIGHASSLVAVDIEATTRAFSRLFGSADLRRQMGETGRRRARETCDWAVVIPQYEALWAELGDARRADAEAGRARAHPWPARLDPFHAFAGYPTRTLTPETRLQLVDQDAASSAHRVAQFRRLAMVAFAGAVVPTEAEVETVLHALAAGTKPAADAVTGIQDDRRPFAFRGLAWLLKLGVLRLAG